MKSQSQARVQNVREELEAEKKYKRSQSINMLREDKFAKFTLFYLLNTCRVVAFL